ncbi:MAG: hypothetical protein ABL888_02115 [Pirellulaceae bacterium]
MSREIRKKLKKKAHVLVRQSLPDRQLFADIPNNLGEFSDQLTENRGLGGKILLSEL